MIPSPRRSFAARLLVAFMGTVGLLLLATLFAVRSETERQVREVTETAVQRAEDVFHEAEDRRMAFLSEASAPFTRGPRARALVQAAIAGGRVEELVADAEYQLDVYRLSGEELLLALVDPDGAPVLTLLHGERHDEGDPASLQPVFREMDAEGRTELETYRVAGGRLYSVQARWLYEGPRTVGGVALGFPISDSVAVATGEIAGVELCFLSDDRCLAGTPLARDALSDAFGELGPVDDHVTVEAAGERWRLAVAPVQPGRVDEVSRAIAVPLEGVLGPLERVSRTLLVSGLLALLVALLASIRLARGLARPVRALMEATGRVARGDYGAEVDVDREDEIGSLGLAFNEMTRGLRLKERYRGVLDKVVSRDVADELVRGDVVLGGETRRATVLFADLRGFTPLTQGMEPQSVIGLLNECMEILSAAVDHEGGIVDKYVGDQIMAVWGAPVRRPDDALRAVRAADRMQDGMNELNYHRERSGEPPVGLGIGVNTGEVVAGNMGSADRLNYTVLGAPVNLASRLCSVAGPGEVLLGPATARALEERIELGPARDLDLKGFTGPVEVRDLPRGTRMPEPRDPDSEEATVETAETGEAEDAAGPAGTAGAAATALAALLLAASGASAQDAELPTLQDARWSSEDGRYELLLSGRLEVEAFLPDEDASGLVAATDPFVAPRLRLFVDAFAGERWYGLLEVRADRGEAPAPEPLEVRVEQAFVRFGPGAGLQLQAGRFASPFGGYAARHLSIADPFVRPPLPYDHRTMVSSAFLPGSTAGFLDWQDDPDFFRPMGAPPVWSVPYQWGAMAMAAAGPVDVRAAWMNGAPSSGPDQWAWDADRLGRGSVVVGAGTSLSPSLRVDASWSWGPYLREDLDGAPLPEGSELDDWEQEIAGLEVVWKRGPSVVRGELLRDRWEVPWVGDDVIEWSWYVEAERDLVAGLWVAARVAATDFGTLTDDSGRAREWDRDLTRWEVGAGYRVARNFELRGQLGDLLSLQAWWAF